MLGVAPLVAAALVAAAAGCVKVKPFEYQDAGTPDTPADGSGNGDGSGGGELTPVLTNNGHYAVKLGDVYQMDFSATGFHFPDAFTIGGVQVLSPNNASLCKTEQGVGVNFYPACTITGIATPGITSTQSDITPELDGTIVKLRLDWAGNMAQCSGTPHGRSTFTFYPDGRITRMDAARLDQPSVAVDCDCIPQNGNDQWELSTYYAFDSSKVTSVVGANVPGGINTSMNIGSSATTTQTVCLDGPTYELAIEHHFSAGRRVRKLSNTAFAMIADMTPPTTASIGGTGYNRDTITTMHAAIGSSCDVIDDKVQAYSETQYPRLVVASSARTTQLTLQMDGMYGGENSQSGTTRGYDPGASLFTLTAETGVPLGPFAVWLDFGNSNNLVSILSTRHTGDSWYRVDRHVMQVAPYHVFWFPHGLVEGERITIEVGP